MEPIRSLDQMLQRLSNQAPKRMVIAAAQDAHTLGAAFKAAKLGLVTLKLVGDGAKIAEIAASLGESIDGLPLLEESTLDGAAQKAVAMVRAGEADVLMKGLASTDQYVKAILNKETGLLKKGDILTHIGVYQIPHLGRLLFASDVAIIPTPDLSTKQKQLRYLIEAAHAFGIECPKAAILSATERLSEKVPSTLDAAILSKMADRGQIAGAIVDGPIALDCALSREAAQTKGLNSPIQGDADLLLFPYLEVGNVFHKTLTFCANAELAAVLAGPIVPCVLTSRSESEQSKLYSIALACMLA